MHPNRVFVINIDCFATKYRSALQTRLALITNFFNEIGDDGTPFPSNASNCLSAVLSPIQKSCYQVAVNYWRAHWDSCRKRHPQPKMSNLIIQTKPSILEQTMITPGDISLRGHFSERHTGKSFAICVKWSPLFVQQTFCHIYRNDSTGYRLDMLCVYLMGCTAFL